ncbi:MAG: hypothetical protein ABIP94_19820 [Planctomycetota bacterium]
MPSAWSSLVLVACLFGVDANAQLPVLTVGGFNPSFTDLPQAVAAAVPGSIIEVRPGSYTGFTTNKPLHIVLDFTAATGSVHAAPGSAYAMTVSGLTSGRFTVAGRGASVQPGTLGAIRIVNTSVYVMLEGLTVAAAGMRTAIDVQNATTVFVQRCALTGTPSLQLQDATLVSSEVSWASPGGSAVVANHGHLDFAHGSFRGFQLPAISVTDCDVRLAGNGSTPIEVSGSPTGPVSAFEAIISRVQWQQNHFALIPAGGAPGFVNMGGTVFPAAVPGLVASGASLGGTASVRMTGSGLPGLIGFNALAPQFSLFELTAIYLDPVSPVIAAIGIVDPTGLSLSAVVPNAATLRGQTFCLQGIVWQSNGWPVWSAAGLWTVL